MVNAFNRVYAVYQSKKVNMRVAAYMVAIERLNIFIIKEYLKLWRMIIIRIKAKR